MKNKKMDSVMRRYNFSFPTIIVGLFCLVFIGLVSVVSASPAQALQTIPYKVNFQGRLTDATGNIKPDGQYNMKLSLFSATSGGTALWSETRGTTNRVQLTNGLFSIQLGDLTALSPSLFTTQPLYLEIELPTPATATCSTAGCATWTEGAMTPRSPLGSSPYAFNADTIDGIDSSKLARVDAANTFTSTNDLNGVSRFHNDLNLDNYAVLGFNALDSGGVPTLQNAGVGAYLMNDSTGLQIDVTAPNATAGSQFYWPVLSLNGNNNGFKASVDSGVTYPDNLISNPGFEFSQAGWQPNGTVVTGASARSGNSNLQFVQSSPTSLQDVQARPIAVQPGDQIYTQMYVNTSASNTGSGGYYIVFYDKDGVNPTFVNSVWTNPGTSYTLRSVTATAPAGAAYAVVVPTVRGDGAAAGTWNFDDVYAKKVNQVAPAVFSNSVNSTNAFTIQNASGTPLLVADTANLDLKIGGGDVSPDTNPTLLVLDYDTSASDPASAINGAMYYNQATQKFRCYEGGAWKNCISSASSAQTTYDYQNDFFLNSSDSSLISSVVGGTNTNQTAESNHPGLVRLALGTASTNRAGYASSGNSILFGSGIVWTARLGLRINALSDTTNTYTMRFGFIDSAAGDGGNGCFFRYSNAINGGRWQGACRNSSTESTCDTGITVSATTWYNLQIGINSTGTAATFVNNGTTACTITTNLPGTAPTNTSGPEIIMIKSVGTGNTKTVDLDYTEFRADNITR